MNNKYVNTLTVKAALWILTLGLLIYGAVHGGMEDVLRKAMMICYECIGIG